MEILFGTKWWWSGLIVFLFLYLGVLSICLGVFLINSKWFYEKSKYASIQKGTPIAEQHTFDQSKKIWAIGIALVSGYFFLVPFFRVHKVIIQDTTVSFKNAWNIPLGTVHTSDITSIDTTCSRNVKYGYTGCKGILVTPKKKYRTLSDRSKELQKALDQLEQKIQQ